MIEAAALANNLPLEFFARVIWQESRFRPDAVGPMTRSGDRAQGIAQFMPRTAAERGLLDPLDPVQALPKSAEFLRELRGQFGNLGLAAAAYNAGPRRVQRLARRHRLDAAETRNYVAADHRHDGRRMGGRRGAQRRSAGAGRERGNCETLMAMLKRAPNPFLEQLEERVRLVAAQRLGRAACRRLFARPCAAILCAYR